MHVTPMANGQTMNELQLFIFMGVQTIQHKLAELKTEICVGRAFMDSVTKIHNDSKLDNEMASMAKYW